MGRHGGLFFVPASGRTLIRRIEVAGSCAVSGTTTAGSLVGGARR